MTLSSATTDQQVIDGLTSRVVVFAAAGEYGEDRRRSLDSRRNRKRLKSVNARLVAWARSDDGRYALRASNIFDDPESVARAMAYDAIVSTLAGWLLSLVAGWVIRKAIEAFVAWLLSPESAAWRAAVESTKPN